jgi:hypothetical protein
MCECVGVCARACIAGLFSACECLYLSLCLCLSLSPPPPSLPRSLSFSLRRRARGQAAMGKQRTGQSSVPAPGLWRLLNPILTTSSASCPVGPTSSRPSIAVSWAARTPCICTYRYTWRGGRSGRKESRRQINRSGSHSRRFCHLQSRSSRVCPGWSLAPCRVQMVVHEMASERAHSHSHDASRIAGKADLVLSLPRATSCQYCAIIHEPMQQ